MRYYFIAIFVSLSFWLGAQEKALYSYEYALIEADHQKVLGNLNEAVNLYRKCLEFNPESSVAAYELGSILASDNQMELAESYLERAYNLDESNYWYILAYSEVLKQNRKYSEAEDILKHFLKNSNDIKLRYSLASVYEEIGNWKKALEILEGIEKENGVSELIILRKVDIYKSKGKYELAEKEIDKLISMVPESVGYQIIKAEYLEEIGEKERAVKIFQAVIETDTSNLYAISSLADYYYEKGDISRTLEFLAMAILQPEIKLENKINTILFYISNNDYLFKYKSGISVLIENLLASYPDDINVKSLGFDFYNKTQDFDNSYIIIKELVKERSDNLVFWQQAVYTAVLLKQYDDVIDLADSALKVFPNRKEFYLFKGISYFEQGDFESSFSICSENYSEGLDIGMQIQYLSIMAESAYKTDRKDLSFTLFEELLLLDPENIGSMNNYAYYLSLENKNLERAKLLSAKTIKAEPENVVFLDTYGWILYCMGDLNGARDYIEKAVMKTADSDVYFHYAEVLLSLGDRVSAAEYYKKARNAGYDDDIIIDRIKKCQEK